MRLNEEIFIFSKTIANQKKSTCDRFILEKTTLFTCNNFYLNLDSSEKSAEGIDKSTKLSAEHSRVYNFASFLS